jgi:hypothetical protein
MKLLENTIKKHKNRKNKIIVKKGVPKQTKKIFKN